MAFLIVAGMIIAVIVLWTRVDKIERRMLILLDRYEALERKMSNSMPSVDRDDIGIAYKRPQPPPDKTSEPTPGTKTTRPATVPNTQPKVKVKEAVALDMPPVKKRPAPKPQKPQKPGFNFEDLFGRRLPIWFGGLTLAVAGILIVKYAIDSGLITPAVRILTGLVFGGALIAGAEVTYRLKSKVQDARVYQSLSGAGISTLYASILFAGNLYGLISPTFTFIALGLITAGALGLSFRFGAPSAVLGLIGGLATPALVQSNASSIPLLSAYLGLLSAGLMVVARRQNWSWLGISTLVGGFGWAAYILTRMVDIAFSTSDIWSIGLLVLALGIAFPFLSKDENQQSAIRFFSALGAMVQIAVIVALGGFELMTWGLYGLISIALLWLSFKDDRLAWLPLFNIGTAGLLLTLWPDPQATTFFFITGVGAVIHALPALYRLWKGQQQTFSTYMVMTVSLGSVAVSLLKFYPSNALSDDSFALMTAAAALLSVTAAFLGWRHETGRLRLTTTAAVLTLGVGAFTVSAWALPVWGTAIALALLALGSWSKIKPLQNIALAFQAIAASLLAVDAIVAQEMLAIFAYPHQAETGTGVIRYGTIALASGIFAWALRQRSLAYMPRISSVIFSYAALAFILPQSALILLTAISIVFFAYAQRQWGTKIFKAPLLTGVGIGALWAVSPAFNWVSATYLSLLGDPVFANALPDADTALLQIGLFATALLGSAFFMPKQNGYLNKAFIIAGGALMLSTVHILYKGLFSITDINSFIAYGLGERAIWMGALAALAATAIAFSKRKSQLAIVGNGLAIASLGYGLWYSLFLHNPLWSAQNVGEWPLSNMLLPLYALPSAIIWAYRKNAPRASSIAQMVLILGFAFSSLHQVFTGTLLNQPITGSAEHLALSVLAILLAIGFLLAGVKAKARDWRIASLVIMLSAVGKVFLYDAAGLDGLLRIGSFVALGFSLIGIGWLYSRQLKRDEAK